MTAWLQATLLAAWGNEGPQWALNFVSLPHPPRCGPRASCLRPANSQATGGLGGQRLQVRAPGSGPLGPAARPGCLGAPGWLGGSPPLPPAGPALPTAAQRLPQLAPAAPSPPGQAGPALATPRAPGGDPRWASQLLPGQRSSGEPPGRECGLVGVT